MSPPSVIRRVATREYAPLAAMIVVWLAIAATVGHADAVRLFAAIAFVRAASALAGVGTLAPLRKRFWRGQHQAQATSIALVVESAALGFTALALAAILSFLWWAGQEQMVTLCLFFALALPVRCLMPLLARRRFIRIYRPTVAAVGLVLIGAGALLGADVTDFALLFVARAWAALLLSFAIAPAIKPKPRGGIDPLRWREIADYSHARGRKQFAYRFSKVFLHALLGPFGTIAARTGRGLRMDRRAERFVPTNVAVLGLLALGAALASAALVIAVPEPALLVVAATLLRMSAAAANILVWNWLSSAADADAEIDDEDDDEI